MARRYRQNSSDAAAGRSRGGKKGARAGYMISSVAEMYRIHPQTLRLYERVGLLQPSRSQGNTRLYTDSDLKQLEVILNLAREMGVNLAGIEIILTLRDRISDMERQMIEFVQFVQQELAQRPETAEARRARGAIIRTGPVRTARVQQK